MNLETAHVSATETCTEARGMLKQMPHGASHVREGVCAVKLLPKVHVVFEVHVLFGLGENLMLGLGLGYGQCGRLIIHVVQVVCIFGFVVCLRNAGGLFLFGVFVGVLGGHANFAFAKLHAQFAYYKSPELGLNLSGS
jgi:hypothetical protein